MSLCSRGVVLLAQCTLFYFFLYVSGIVNPEKIFTSMLAPDTWLHLNVLHGYVLGTLSSRL